MLCCFHVCRGSALNQPPGTASEMVNLADTLISQNVCGVSGCVDFRAGALMGYIG